MAKYLLFLSFFVLVSAIVLSKTQDSKLVVIDNKSQDENFSYLIKYTDDPLELICKVKNNTEDQISLSWLLPKGFSEHNGTKDGDGDGGESFNETSIIVNQSDAPENGSVKLFISSLQSTHSGSYICESISNTSGTFTETVHLFVKPKEVICGKKFECGYNQCIPIFYKCDGVPDCKNKTDEAPDLCGPDPCKDRYRCNNGRCIPAEWCKVCDHLKSNCTNRFRHECCPPLEDFSRVMPFSDGSYPHPRRHDTYHDLPNVQHQYDINFIQTTIYTIIGCALVFMIIVTILVIAICRVHLKRTQPVHLPNNRRVFATTAYHRAFTQDVYDLDISLNRSDAPGLLVTYNINNGVQIVGSPVEPPPYSEVASLPPREGPPPPYALSQPCNGESARNVRSVECETSPKSFSRGLTPGARVSSEPSLPNLRL